MIKDFSTKHTADTDNPQTYWQHGWFALKGSIGLIFLGLGGIVHAFFPEIKCLQFWTSSGILKYAKKLEDSRRHDIEIREIWSGTRLHEVKQERYLGL